MSNKSQIPRLVLVDMNSFFASVEQQANPAFRGKPLGVCASLHETSCIIGTSKEAKALGITNGTPTYKAKKICPKIILVQSEPEKYREVNRGINKIFLDYTQAVETYSVDESFLDFRQSKLNPVLVGGEIKRRIKAEVGEWLTCSVGIAANKFLCKLAADLEKPDGLSMLWPENLPEVYRQKKLKDLWGINRGWTNRLLGLGIISPLQLLNYPVENLISVFGKPGFFIWQRVNGLEQDEVASESSVSKSFGHSWVLNFRSTDKEQLKKVILHLAEKAARRMRAEGFLARGIYVSIRLSHGDGMYRSKLLNFELETGWDLYEQVLKIWSNWQFKFPVVRIAVGFTNLRLKSNQLSLFEQPQTGLVPALDLINDKYGEFTIRSGLLAETFDYAPDAIAFGK